MVARERLNENLFLLFKLLVLLLFFIIIIVL